MRSLFICLCALAIGSAAFAADPVPEDKLIDKLVKELGSDSWRAREAASKGLRDLGRKPKAKLLEAVKSPDLEVVKRSERLLETIFNEEAWDPVAIEISAKDTKLRQIFAQIESKSGVRLLWGPPIGHGNAPEDSKIDFEAKGTVAEVLEKLCKKSGTTLVCPISVGDGTLRIVPATGVPIVSSGNVWVTLGTAPFRYGDGTICINLQIISDGNQALSGAYLPLKVKATTDAGETIESKVEELYGHLPASTGPCRKIDRRFELPAPGRPYEKLAKLEVEACLITYGSRKTVTFDKLDAESEKGDGSATFRCSAIKEHGIKGTTIWTVEIAASRGFQEGPELTLFDDKGGKVKAHYARPVESYEYTAPRYEVFFDLKKMGAPSRIEMSYYTRSAYKTVNVTLKDVPVK